MRKIILFVLVVFISTTSYSQKDTTGQIKTLNLKVSIAGKTKEKVERVDLLFAGRLQINFSVSYHITSFTLKMTEKRNGKTLVFKNTEDGKLTDAMVDAFEKHHCVLSLSFEDILCEDKEGNKYSLAPLTLECR